jgi:hypothetical protein
MAAPGPCREWPNSVQAGKQPTERKPSGTDWERVKREAAVDASVPFDAAADAGIGPYAPNNAATVAAYWQVATIKRSRGLLPR